MKSLMVCIALMSSASAFAGLVEDGAQLLASGKAQVEKNILDITQLRNSASNMALDLKEFEVKSPKLKAINATCSATFLTRAEKEIEYLEDRYVDGNVEMLSKHYKTLVENAQKAEKAKKCSECDDEIRRATVEKYLYAAYVALDDMKIYSNALPTDILKELSKNRFCDYSGLFAFNDSAKFARLKDWSYGNYSAHLSPSEILSGEFTDTLDLIIRKYPMKVNRSASLFGSESSEYKNGKVNIQITYDDSFITGFDNVRHPKLTNVLDIIQRDR